MPFRYCEHIKTDGIQCHSPAMGDGRWCYYHGLYRRRIRSHVDPDVDIKNLYRKQLGLAPIPNNEQERQQYVLGPLEDAPSVQVALSTVINALAGNRLDRARATALLYGLQLAANNLRGIATTSENHTEAPAPSGNPAILPPIAPAGDPDLANELILDPLPPGANPLDENTPKPSASSSSAGTCTQDPATEELTDYLGIKLPRKQELAPEIPTPAITGCE